MSTTAPAPADPGEPLTTAHVAKLLGVSPKTVQLWAGGGGLPCWRIGTGARRGGDRRFRRADVIAFSRARGIAIAPELLSVLAVGWPWAGPLPTPNAVLSHGLLDAARRAALSPPDAAVVFGGTLGRADAIGFGRYLRASYPAVWLVGLLSDDDTDTAPWHDAGFDVAFRPPPGPAAAAAAAGRAIGSPLPRTGARTL
jgi:excisionase family DNA binding protein